MSNENDVEGKGLEYKRPTNRRYGQWAGEPDGHAEDATRCVCEVWPAVNAWVPCQCGRKRGHGPGGLYCKAHGRAAAIDAGLNPGGESQTVWIVVRDNLAVATLDRETEKSFWITEYKNVWGSLWFKIDGPNSKDNAFVYKTEAEAIQHLIARQRGYIKSANDAIERAEKAIAELQEIARGEKGDE